MTSVACAAAPRRSATVFANEEMALFTAVVRRMVAEHGKRLRVDPRPLPPDSVADAPDFLVFAEPGALLPDAPRTVVDARSAALRALGLSRGDAIVVSRCPGTMLIDAPPELRKNCPRSAIVVAILALPRAATPTELGPDSGATLAARNRGHLLVRALEMHADRFSRHTYLVNYVLGRADEDWIVVNRRPVFILE